MKNTNNSGDSTLSGLLTLVEKEYGAGAMMRFSDKPKNHPAISTGLIGLDNALGIQGIPVGRITEIFGTESSGKSSLCLQIIANAQKSGRTCVYIDSEHALDPALATLLGVNLDDLFIAQPDDGNTALNLAETLANSGQVGLIVVDSVAALVPRSELDGSMGDANVGVQARLMSQACRKLTPAISKHNVALVFVNQLRDRIGIMFGNPATTTGGNALKYASSVRIELSSSQQIKDGDVVVGRYTKAKVVKNKLAPPFREYKYEITFGSNHVRVNEILELGVEAKAINKAGSWYSYGDERMGQGRDSAKQWLLDNPDKADEIETRIYLYLGMEVDDTRLKKLESAAKDRAAKTA